VNSATQTRRPMSFLDAHRIASSFPGGSPLETLLATSGGVDNLEVFLRAAAAKRGRTLRLRSLPFNTLAQAVRAHPAESAIEVFALFPWDFVPEADWRSGLPGGPVHLTEIQERATAFAKHLQRRKLLRALYVPAPIPSIFHDSQTTAVLQSWLTTLAVSLGAKVLEPRVFSLSSYLANGGLFSAQYLGEVADQVIESAVWEMPEPAKVLVTDLDNVLWAGVIGEDGVDGISYRPEGTGFPHFVYQSALAKLKREGTLLAAVSRNSPDLATAPFLTGQMCLRQEDFVSIVASYNAKSSQIREIATRLNLGLDSFVFVDDNPIELEEVARALPSVRTLAFPSTVDALPAFLENLCALFSRPVSTSEDAERTEMYRRRMEGMLPDASEGSDLTGFLRNLKMSMTIRDRSAGDRSRAVQLINKTNQFNLNGRRVTDDEVASILSAGGRLYGVSLDDRTGSHGEVLACLINGSGTIESLVMSCRIFQRRLEFAFLAWLADKELNVSELEFSATPRNEPVQQFLTDKSFSRTPAGRIAVDLAQFRSQYADDLALFEIVTPAPLAAPH